jgi:cytochrome c-type biogenesis protein CcmH
MKQLLSLIAALVIAAAGTASAQAQTQAAPAAPQEAPTIAEDPALEKRVNKIGEELRCLVCQNQTITDSHAGLAVDLKNQIREQLQAGRSEKQIIEFMVERYGDFVLYRPPMKATTLLLWAGPFVLLGIAIAGAAVVLRRRRALAAGATPLTEAQRRKAAQLLQDEPETRS